jgi:S-adenosylmethionine hydrolase
VTHVDRFGNAITSLPAADIAALGARVGPVEVLLPDGTRLALRMTYAEVERGAALALISSADTLEVSVREGSAAAGFGLGPGDIVQVVRQEARS